jgi:hypothetical protein
MTIEANNLLEMLKARVKDLEEQLAILYQDHSRLCEAFELHVKRGHHLRDAG